MNGDVQITVSGTTSDRLPATLLTHIDMLAGTLYGLAGWRVVVEIDPGIVLTAAPARETEPPTHGTPPPGSDFTARFTDEDGEDG